MRKYLIVLLGICSLQAFSQKGTIRGTVYDNGSGETVIGANVLIKNTLNGTSTDLDGKFTLEVEEGVYDVQVSYISYETLTISDVKVTANEVSLLNNIKISEKGLQLGEVMITATASRKSEAALNTIKKKSIAMMDGISSEKMMMTGDATAVEAAKRVTGVSIEGGKYVYVRGLGDRYSKTTLNGVDIPGLDPDKNTLQMDIFPSNLIDNMMISKNFTADMPADFTGGILNIETKAFPDNKILNISIGTAYNPSMHFNPEYLSYEGGETDFLGYDDGTRALPQRARSTNIPTPVSGASKQEVSAFVNSFNPTLGATESTSLMDFSASITLGNQINLQKKNSDNESIGSSPKLGYIFSLAYKSDYKFYDDVTYGEYQRYDDENINEMRYATIQKGKLAERNILIGSLAGLAFKTKTSKLRLTFMHLQSGESRAGQFWIDNDGAAVGQSGYLAKSDNLEYNQRALSNVLLNGTHNFSGSGWELDWRVSPTFSSSDDPDIRRTAFTYTANDTLFMAGAGGNPSRIWRSLSELNATAKVDITKDYKIKDDKAKLKFGFNQTYKQRDYEILSYNMQFFGSQNWNSADPNKVLDQSNIYPSPNNNIYYQSGNNNPNPNAYESNVSNTAAYISNEMFVFPSLRAILGLRMENYVQRHTGRDQSYAGGDKINGRNLNDEIVLESMDFFPSMNLIYSLAEEQNLRFSYSKTIARPSFKELSFAQIIDPITNRIFNGSLYPYADWDGKLTETRIDNLDMRWEKFMSSGQVVSVSVFYKKFDNPIELVRIPEQPTSTEYQPRNVGNGFLTGIELELSKKMDFISPKLKNFNLSTNFTFVQSEIKMTSLEYNSRKSYERVGENIDANRQMAGQAPYVINAGLGYNNMEKGIDVGIYYNVKGPTLYIVGAGLFPDIYIEPFHSLNLSLNKKVGEQKKTSIDFRIANLLNEKVESVYKSYEAEDKIFSSINPGMTFSVGVSRKF